MTDFLYYVVAFVVALGVLVVVHEFGHFWAARRLGVKVLRFSIGFGKPLWVRRVGRDRMELVVAALPLGGYVKMLDENEGEVAPRELHRAFNRQKVWKRSLIVVAGPLFNFLFAILAYGFVNLIGVDGVKPVVGKVMEGSRAEQAGFRVGDELLRIDGKEVLSWDHRRLYLFRRALDRAVVRIEVRDAQDRLRERVLDLANFPAEEVGAGLMERGIGLFGYLPQALPEIGALEPGPAMRAGLEIGDRIVEVDGRPVRTWEELVAGISRNPGRSIGLTAERGGKALSFVVTPDSVEQDGRKIGRINIRPRFAELPPEMRVRVRLPPLTAFTESVDSTWSMSWLTLQMLYRMLKLEVSTKNLSGPLTIAQYAGHSAKVGLDQFVIFLAVISISLGVLNLLPIPVLDGGHLLYYAIEAVKGGPLPPRALELGQRIGIALLVALMLLAFYNDLTRIFR